MYDSHVFSCSSFKRMGCARLKCAVRLKAKEREREKESTERGRGLQSKYHSFCRFIFIFCLALFCFISMKLTLMHVYLLQFKQRTANVYESIDLDDHSNHKQLNTCTERNSRPRATDSDRKRYTNKLPIIAFAGAIKIGYM